MSVSDFLLEYVEMITPRLLLCDIFPKLFLDFHLPTFLNDIFYYYYYLMTCYSQHVMHDSVNMLQ